MSFAVSSILKDGNNKSIVRTCICVCVFVYVALQVSLCYVVRKNPGLYNQIATLVKLTLKNKIYREMTQISLIGEGGEDPGSNQPPNLPSLWTFICRGQ